MKKYGRFHDGFFEGFWIDGTTVQVHLSTLEKERFTAVAEGVVALAANGFRAGNIVFDVVARGHEEIAMRCLYGPGSLDRSSRTKRVVGALPTNAK
jgi:hypothetical protein